MIRVSLEFKTAQEALSFLSGLAEPVQQSAPIATVAGEAVVEVAKKRGRPRKENAQPEVASNTGSDVTALPSSEDPSTELPLAADVTGEEGEAPADETPLDASPAPVTVETVREALKNVMETHGMPACTAILKQFGAARVSELKPEHYANFVDACEAA